MEKKEIDPRKFREGNISLILDSYDDIFSDFDPRPFAHRALSDDFLLEAKRAARDKQGSLELRFLIPKNERKLDAETIIKGRLREHFKSEEATLEAKAQSLHAQIEPVEDLLPVVHRGTGYHSVYDLLEHARTVLREGNVREAGRLLKEAQKLQRKLSLAENDERKLRYDLLEIETDIKLATL